MSKDKEEKGFYSDFLREDAPELATAFGDQEQGMQPLVLEEKQALPRLPKAEPAPEPEMQSYWRGLRAFFRRGKGGGIGAGTKSGNLFPALLAFSQERQYAQEAYPFWMADNPTADTPTCTPLEALLTQAIAQMPEEGKARLDSYQTVLKNKLSEPLAQGPLPRAFIEIADKVFEELERKNATTGEEGKKWAQQLRKLREKLPAEGWLLPFSRHTTFFLLDHAIQMQRARHWKKLEKSRNKLVHQLQELLEVEQDKSSEASDATHLHDAMDFADSYINFDELAAVMPATASEPMPTDRLQRLERVLDTLQKGREILFEKDALLIVADGLEEKNAAIWQQLFSACQVKSLPEGKLCQEAIRQFESIMPPLCEFFAAMRIARLELDGQYQPEIHEEDFAHFDWRSLTPEEMAACPPVVVLTEVEALLRSELNAFSFMLSTNRPIRTLAIRQDARASYDLAEADSFVSQQEPGSFAISHRNTFVLQSTPVSPDHLYQGMIEGLQYKLPGLWYVLAHAEANQNAGDDYLWTSAAVASRDFPVFTYNEEKGARWGSRFDLTVNPQADQNWPVHELTAEDPEGQEVSMSLAFTFADFAAQDPAFQHRFLLVPPSYWTDDLIPFADYLSLSHQAQFGKVPFIWMVDTEGRLQKVAVAWPVVQSSQEQQEFWDYLQENAGVHSYHVEIAVEQLRQELEAKKLEEIAALQAQHEAALTETAQQAAGEAMERLAAALLDMDAATELVSSVSQPTEKKEMAASPPETEEVKTPETVPEKGEEEEEELVLGEAYIDTPLCTTCNECTNLNGSIFKYNDEKQAYIADPTGGPFLDIVRAAELCPAGIIHPGAPQNPNEAGLKDLIKRAEPFNA